MIKKIKKIIIILILLFFCLYLIINPIVLTNSVNYSINIFLKYLFPTLFPFFILTDLLINYNVTYYIGKILKKTFGFLFNIGEEESFIYILSIFTGQPSNAKYIKDLLDRNVISIKNATIFLSYSFFPSPMFIIGTIGILFYNNIFIGIIIFISILLSNSIFAIIIRNKYDKNNNSYKYSKPFNFGKIINKSILSSFNTLLLILGSITIFIIIINTFKHLVSDNTIFNTLISGLLEITIASKNISVLDINLYFKILLTTIILSFGGISVHTQVKSILCDYNIKYFTILKYKFYIMVISFIIAILLIIIMANYI